MVEGNVWSAPLHQAGTGSTTYTSPKRTSRRDQTNGKRKCQVCGRSNHDSGSCRFKNYSCDTCGVLGHLAPMCNNRGTKHKTQNNVKTILKKYPNVFSEELGTFNGYKISLTVNPGTTPKFYKHRPVPLALREKVETEIDRLLAINALIPVDHSEWATPVVPIL